MRNSAGGEGCTRCRWSGQSGIAPIPSMRMVADLADLEVSRWVLHAGASGHAFQQNYTDQSELWCRNERLPWRVSGPAVRQEAAHTVVLTP